MSLKIKALKRAAGALLFGAALLLGTSAVAKAQGHSQSHERRDLKDHQRQERYVYGNNGSTRNHQSQERGQLKYEQRAERSGYYNNSHNGGYYGNGQYNNGHSNGGYYNNGHSNGNGGYYAPHYDSRNPVRRALHHASGGH
jgi:hypothetical protein